MKDHKKLITIICYTTFICALFLFVGVIACIGVVVFRLINL